MAFARHASRVGSGAAPSGAGSLSKTRPPACVSRTSPTLEATVENFSAVSRGTGEREKQMTAYSSPSGRMPPKPSTERTP